MSYVILWIMAIALVWRIALRPRILRRQGIEAKHRSPAKPAIYAYFVLASVEIAVAVAILLVWPRLAWAALAVIITGQELRFWVFNVLLSRFPPSRPAKIQE